MSATKIAAIALIVGGVLGLIYGNFSYTSDTHTAHMGTLELTVKDRQRVNIPVWLGVGAVVAGAALLIVPSRKR